MFMRRSNLGIPILLLLMLALMTLRVPAFVLDIAFTFNIALSVVVLLVSIYALRPLDFAVFPTMLLVATLLRLALNVASTRVVLLEGHKGGDAAGQVIQSFGEVVVGGNYVVGLVVFIILVIINFVVVTKGAGRISEVSARFTLDAMPGKQMAIDADLNAGIIDQDQAKRRREEVGQEADFYGSMDGASKFVRGDAVAGILILLINVLGGFAIGLLQHDLPLELAVQHYTLLTIGDGLVAQIPSLLLSTAAAIMVTRVSGESDVREQVSQQMFSDPKALAVAAGVLLVMGSIPGMPHLVFLGLGLAAAFGAWRISQGSDGEPTVDELPATAGPEPEPDLAWSDLDKVDPLGLEIGYRIIPLVDANQSGELLKRIRGVRKKLSSELGFLIPPVHVRDNLDLLPNRYRLNLLGVVAGEGEIHPDKLMAIDPGETFGRLDGIVGKDPAFGLDAIWIDTAQRDHAQTLGYTVVDASTVVATHLNRVLQDNAHELLGHDDAQRLLDVLAETAPKLVEQLIPGSCSLSDFVTVLQGLLRESIPVRDVRTIAAALVACGAGADPEVRLHAVRRALGRLIVQNIYGAEPTLDVITLEPDLEALLLQANSQGAEGSAPKLEPGLADRLQQSVAQAADRQEIDGKPAVLLVSSALRSLLARFVRLSARVVHVLAFEEIPESRQISVVSTIGRGG